LEKKRKKQNKQGLRVIPGEGKRFSFSTLKQAFIYYILFLLALVIIVQLGYHWLGEQFLSWRLQVIEAEVGIMYRETRVEGIIVRQEEIITAPAGGMILRLAEAGVRVPAGAEVATLGVLSRSDLQALRGSDETGPDEALWDQLLDYWHQVFPHENESESFQDGEPGSADQARENNIPDRSAFIEIITIYTEHPGMVSHYIDGFEEYEEPYYPSQEASSEENYGGSFTMEGDLVEHGSAMIKIVDNWQWNFSLILPLHSGRTVALLPSVDIELDFAPGQPVRGRLIHSEIDEGRQEVRLTYLIEKQIAGFDQVRRTEATLLHSRAEGIIVPGEAIFQRDNSYGVYINQGGRVVYKPVGVLYRQGEQVMIDGIAPASLVITRPDLVEEGQRLN
jgi:putative membrane fusion protein